MSSRNLAIAVVLISAVAVAFLLGKNASLTEQLTESEARQQSLRQSLIETLAPTASSSITVKPTLTPTPTPRSVESEEVKQEKASTVARTAETVQKVPASTPRPCVIIGNKNSGIYHLPGCPSYNPVASYNREYFCTEDEAQKAGYRKAKNC